MIFQALEPLQPRRPHWPLQPQQPLQPQKPYFTKELRGPDDWIVPGTKMTQNVPFLLNYGALRLQEVWTFEIHQPVIKKVTSAGLNSLKNKRNQISVKNWILDKIYELYADFALKNPFYSLEMPIRADLFDQNLQVAIDQIEKTGFI